MSEKPSILRKIAMADFELSDVTFLVGANKEKIKGFRQILALSNSVFRRMLFGNFKDQYEIEVPEFEAKEFRIFLEYLYFEEIDLTTCDPFKIYMIAHKYMVSHSFRILFHTNK